MWETRLKNYALWVSLFAFIPLLSIGLDTYNIKLLLPSNYSDLTVALLGILVLLGIINNPTTVNRGFGDDKDDKLEK